jgi:TRAP-type C4-dicarboxylate transport system permease small subunit
MLRLNGLVAVVVFVALTAVVSLQVVSRLAVHFPVIWSEEVARFLFFWAVLLGAAMSVRKRRHFSLDVLPRRWHEGTGAGRFVLDAIPDLSILGFSAFLLIEGLGYARAGALRTATNSGINMTLVYAAIPAFAALAILYSATNLLADYRAFRAGAPPVGRPPAAE